MATLAAVVAIPATASASTTHAKPTKASVQVHVNKADTAVKRLKRYARLGDGVRVERQLKIARSQSADASRIARQLANSATTGHQTVVASQALTLAGTQYDDLVAAVTAIVDQISGQVQALVANSIAPSMAGKQKVIDALTQLLGTLPTEVQPVVASIIAALSANDTTGVVNMNQALDTGLPTGITGVINQALSMATSLITQAFSTIQGIIPMLPTAAQGPISQILNLVSSTVGTLVPTVLQSVTGLINTILGSLPFVGGTSASAGGMFGLGGLLGGILGGFGGGSSAGGSTPSTGGIAGLGGIMSSVTGLLNNLLGGLFGGQLVPST